MASSSGEINGSAGGDYKFWNSGPSLSQTESDALSEWLEAKILSVGEVWSINSSTKTLQMALGWDQGVDVDASAALFDQHLKNIDSVSYKNPQNSCGSVVHSGDNLTGYGDGDDDEIITVHLAKLPLEVHYVLFAVTLYNSNMTFSEINNVSVAMRYGEKGSKGSDVFRLPLSDLSGSAVLVGQLVRLGARWEFKALGVPTTGRTIDAVLQDPCVTEHMSKSISVSPVLRRIRVSVLKGRNLAPKDTSLLRKQTSDPYYRAAFRDRNVKSEYQKKTLNPVWQPQTLDLGLIAESQPDVLEISVFDHDHFSSDDFMGLVHVAAGDLYHLEPGEKHTYWFPLRKSQDSKYANEEVSGEILIEIDANAIAGQENEV